MTDRPISKKPIYNLNLVVQETGLKADTLRAWERRYKLPKPNRTDAGHRLFSDYDIETIKWLLACQEEGMRISQAVELWREIEGSGQDPLFTSYTDSGAEPVSEMTDQEKENLTILRDNWIQACLNFDEPAADQILTQSFARFSFESVCIEILQSGLSQIGSLWYQGRASVQQEHFASELALRRLHALILAAPQPVREQIVLVACPPEENHTFSILLIALFLRHRSWKVIYLGADVPEDRLKETIDKTNPDLVVMASMRLATAPALCETAQFLRELNIPLAFGGWAFNNIPGLSEKIPGYYLGEDMIEAISTIEGLIASSQPPTSFETLADLYMETIANFIENKHQIEFHTLEQVKQAFGSDLSLDDIEQANEFLANDIIAALSLGDLSLLGSNLEWVHDLIANRSFPKEVLFNYLKAYSDAAQPILDETGQPIIDWLASIINSSSNN